MDWYWDEWCLVAVHVDDDEFPFPDRPSVSRISRPAWDSASNRKKQWECVVCSERLSLFSLSPLYTHSTVSWFLSLLLSLLPHIHTYRWTEGERETCRVASSSSSSCSFPFLWRRREEVSIGFFLFLLFYSTLSDTSTSSHCSFVVTHTYYRRVVE